MRALRRAILERLTAHLIVPITFTHPVCPSPAQAKVKDAYRLVFLDSVTGTAVPCGPDGSGYRVSLPKQWLIDHGPRIRDGLRVVKLALLSGKIAGLPIDGSCLPKEVVSKRELQAVAKMETLLNLSEPEITGTLNKRQQKAATGKAYRALKALIAEQCDDKDLQHCGLAKVKARDGTVEWVSYDSRVRFENEGAACLIWNINAPKALGSSRCSSMPRLSSCESTVST